MADLPRYIIVKSHYQEELAEHVSENMSSGYIPVGGVALYYGSSSGAYFIQAMMFQRRPHSWPKEMQ